MKDIIKSKEKYMKLLMKICEDLNIKDKEQIIQDYCKKAKNKK